MTQTFRIMIVDDNETILDLLSTILEEDYEILACESGENALVEIHNFKPHILLLDIMMPGMNGYEVCRKIRADKTLSYTKILFLSARGMLEDRLKGYEVEADDYLVKPFENDELLAKIRVFIRLIREEEKRKQAEAILRQSEEKYRMLVETTPDIIFNVDQQGTILFTNDSVKNVVNENIVGKKIFEYMPIEFHDMVKSKLDKAFSTGEIDCFEASSFSSGENIRWYSTRIGPNKQNDKLSAVTLIYRDITEQKQNEEELKKHRFHLEDLVVERTNELENSNEQLQKKIIEQEQTEGLLQKSEEKYRSILENIEEGYYETDLKGQFTFLNNSMSRIFDCPIDQLIERDYRTLSDEKNINKIIQSFREVYSTNESKKILNWEIPQRNGLNKYLETSISLVLEDEKKVGYRGLIRDVTEKQLYQRSIESLFKHAVGTLARAAEVYDQDTGDHIIRIGDYSKLLAELAGMNSSYQKEIQVSAQLHDVGKIHIASSMLNKKGSLTEDEFEKIKNHTLYGSIIIGRNPDFKMASEIAMFHHEKWNGSGYPIGIRSRAIPLAARITSIVDVFDALISKRSYKNSIEYNTAKEIITNGDNRLDPKDSFDPRLLKFFLDNYEHFVAIHQKSLLTEKEFLAQRINIVLLEDDVHLQSVIKENFKDELTYVDVFGFTSVKELKEFLEKDKDFFPHLCFIDVALPDGSGHDVAFDLKEKYPEAHLICITADEDINYQKVNLYAHRVFRKQPMQMDSFMRNMIKTAEIIREYDYNPLKI